MSLHLFVCHACSMIGTEAEATAHRIVTGHSIEKLDEDTSQAVLDEQAKLRAERVVAYVQHAKARV